MFNLFIFLLAGSLNGYCAALQKHDIDLPSTADGPSEKWRLDRAFCRHEYKWKKHLNESLGRERAESFHREGFFSCPFAAKWAYRGFNCQNRLHQILSYDLVSSCCNKVVNHGATSNPHVLRCLQGKRMLFIGDSLTQNHFIAQSCLLWTIAKSSNKKMMYRTKGVKHGPQMFLAIPSISFNMTLADTHSGYGYDQVVQRTLNDSLWKIYPENVVVLSTGHHWTSHRVRPGFTPPDLEGYRQNWAHISDIIKQHQKISMELYSMDVYFVVRTIEPRHFQGGEWDQGGTCGGFHDSLSGRWPSGENHNQYHVADSMSQIIRRELYQLDN